MIARFDHRPVLTALLALSTTVLFVVVITLTTLLLTAGPPAATSSGESGGGNPGAAVLGTSDNYGDGWNNYGRDTVHGAPIHDAPPPQPTQRDGAGDPVDRHAEVVAAYNDNR